jgi:hypothetical protein
VKAAPHQRGSLCTFTSKSSTMEKNVIARSEEEPQFELPVENELLMMKLKAEFGAECTTGTDDIPPLVVNEFLKSVYEFEQKFREPKNRLTIYEKIGRPFFINAQSLNAKQVGRELKKLMRSLHEQKLELDVLGEYDDMTIYKFLTEEFFEHEMEDMEMPGYIHHFCYEEFHPNHEMDIRSRTVEFLTQWFSQKINEYSWELGDPFIHPDTRVFTKESILKKINNLFGAYKSFSNCEYVIKAMNFEWDDQKEFGDGCAEGWVKYDAITEGNEVVHYSGPFKLYLSNNCTWWSIFYFVFPGFSWNG